MTGTVYAELSVYQALGQRTALHAAACFLSKPVMPEVLLDRKGRLSCSVTLTGGRGAGI